MNMARSNRSSALLWLAVLFLPAAATAQLSYTNNYGIWGFITNGGTITITGHTGSNTVVIIPDTINGLPVNNIGPDAFNYSTNLGSVTIGNGVTNIGGAAFETCLSLTNLTIGNGVEVIGPSAFDLCSSLTHLTIGNSVKLIGHAAFLGCSGLTSVTIGEGVTNVSDYAFADCPSLTNIIVGSSVASIGSYAFRYCGTITSMHFEGNAPSLPGGTNAFYGDHLTVFYLPGTVGWGPTFAGFPTAVWTLPYPLILSGSIGLGNSQQFGFTVSWASNASVVVETSTDIIGSTWLPITTNAIISGWFLFSDPETTNFPTRFYRLRSF